MCNRSGSDDEDEDTAKPAPLPRRIRARTYDPVERKDGNRGIVTGVVEGADGTRMLHIAWMDGTWSNEKDEDVEVIDLTR